VIQLRKFLVSRWKFVSNGQYQLVRETISATSLEEAETICRIRQLNETVTPMVE